LTHTPKEDTIVVFENGTPIPGWYYISFDNTVYFDTPPDEGVLVEIGYSVEEYIVENIKDTGIILP